MGHPAFSAGPPLDPILPGHGTQDLAVEGHIAGHAIAGLVNPMGFRWENNQ